MSASQWWKYLKIMSTICQRKWKAGKARRNKLSKLSPVSNGGSGAGSESPQVSPLPLFIHSPINDAPFTAIEFRVTSFILLIPDLSPVRADLWCLLRKRGKKTKRARLNAKHGIGGYGAFEGAHICQRRDWKAIFLCAIKARGGGNAKG